MPKNFHEIRDPVHGFIRYSNKERDVINARPFQRLRHIRQLSMSNYVYPGAVHTRFEHSLGVMELASRIFDVLFDPNNLNDNIKAMLPECNEQDDRHYWRHVVRMAALSHDLGHLPFSHGTESLLPQGVTHEKISWDIIMSGEMKPLWEKLKINPKDVAKLALGPKDIKKQKLEADLSTWETILSEIITGDMFGADRMDYLLRDSYHAGVKYGHFDHNRIVSTLRILPKPPEADDESTEVSDEPAIGIERSSLYAAADLIWARNSMYSQVYLHHVRRSYDMHLVAVMKSMFPEGFPLDVESFMCISDSDIISHLRKAAYNDKLEGHMDAKCIEFRRHFRMVCDVTPAEKASTLGKERDALDLLFCAGQGQWGPGKIRKDGYQKAPGTIDFPVMIGDDARRTASAISVLPVLKSIPPVEAQFIFAAPEIASEAKAWFNRNRREIIEQKGPEDKIA